MIDPSTLQLVFLSYSSTDKLAVEELARRLESSEPPFRCWLDSNDLRASATWMSQIEEVLGTCRSAILFVGPLGMGQIQDLERQVLIALAAHSRKSGNEFNLVPVLLPGATKPDVRKFESLYNWVDFGAGLDSPAAFDRLYRLLRGEAPRTSSADDQIDGEPYRGLERFEGEHAQHFFGRTEDIRRLCGLVENLPFVAIIGPSGCGKSSLVRAGLKTNISRSTFHRLMTATTLTVLPGSDPTRALAEQIAAAIIPDDQRERRAGLVDDYVGRFRARRDGLRTLLLSLFPKSDDFAILIIDQFEEILTHSRGGSKEPAASAAWFAELLADLVSHAGTRIRLLITLRSDFLPQCLKLPALRDLLAAPRNPQFLLGELNSDQLREVIVLPAQRLGAYFEKGLVAQILKDLENQPGSLPLLEHSLKELWQRRSGRWLTNDGYEASGGVANALRQRADSTLASMSPEQVALARMLFLRLTHFDGFTATRRRVRTIELYPKDPHVNPAPPEVLATSEVIDRLRGWDARLIVISDDGTVEVTHEALISGWNQLKIWLEKDREAKRLHDRLSDAARDWFENNPTDEADRDPSLLWEGGRLEDAVKLGRDQPQMFNVRERRFVECSVGRQERRQRNEIESARTREAEAVASFERQKTLARRAIIAAGLAIALAGLAGAASWVAYRQTSEADAARVAATERSAEKSWVSAVTARDRGNPIEARAAFLEAAEAYASIGHASDVESALLAAPATSLLHTFNHGAPIQSCEFSRDNQTILTLGKDLRVKTWSTQTGAAVALIDLHAGESNPDHHLSFATGARFIQKDEHLLAWTLDGAAVSWKLTDREPIHYFAHRDVVIEGLGHTGDPITISAEVSPNGKYVLTSGREGSEMPRGFWDIQTGELLDVAPLGGAAIHPTQAAVLLFGLERPTLWDPIHKTKVERFTEHGTMQEAHFSRDGRTLLSVHGDGRVVAWDFETANPRQVMSADRSVPPVTRSAVAAAQLSADGQRAIICSHRGAVSSVALDSGSRVADLRFTGPCRNMHVAPSSPRTFFSSLDQAILMDDARGVVISKATSTEAPMGALATAWHNDELFFVAQDGEGTFLWQLPLAVRLRELYHSGPIEATCFSPDGSKLLVAGAGTGWLWDLDDPKRRPYAHFSHDPDSALIIDRRHARIVHRRSDKTIELRNYDGILFKALESDRVFEDVEMSGDGNVIMAWSDSGVARTWSAEDGTALTTVRHQEPPAVTKFGEAAISADGRRIATWDDNGREIILWNGSTGKPEITIELDDYSRSAEFSGDGTEVLVSGGSRVTLHGSRDGAKIRDLYEDSFGNLDLKGASYFCDDACIGVRYSRPHSTGALGAAATISAHLELMDRSGNAMGTVQHDVELNGASCLRDHKHLLSWGGGGRAQIVSLAEHAEPLVFQHEGSDERAAPFRVVGALLSSDESRLLTWSNDGSVRLWDAGSGAQERRFTHRGAVTLVKPNETWTHFVSATGSDVYLWSLEKQDYLMTLRHGGEVVALEWLDTERILVSSANGIMSLWKLEKKEPLPVDH